MKDELRKLIERWRAEKRTDFYNCAKDARQDCIRDIEALLARASEPGHDYMMVDVTVDPFGSASEPEQAARERLGRWLADHPGWLHRKGEYPDGAAHFCDLVLPHGGSHRASGRSLPEAVNAALDLAEGKEPTT